MRIMTDVPKWIARPSPQDDPTKRQRYDRTRRYFLRLYRATPRWLTREQRAEYYAIFRRMRVRRRRGEDVNVDHIVPLCSPYVCGLNVPWNLEIIPASANNTKKNHWWPGCPWENHEFPFDYGPWQLTLGFSP